MKITLINKTASGGGAAMACRRLFNALSGTGFADAKILVQEYSGNDKNIIATTSSTIKKYLNFIRFVWERLCFLPFERSKAIRFAFSLANTGENIAKLDIVKNADVIHLHWFNQGFLSFRDIKKILKLNKLVVWTMHDMWAFTGGCHYTGDCKKFRTNCNFCPYLKKPSENDLASRIFRKKINLFANSKIAFVGCSEWMASEAKSSFILKNSFVTSIPNPIDTELYKPIDKDVARKEFDLPLSKKIILFGAAKVTDKRKGLEFLLQAINEISDKQKEDYLLVMFGRTVGLPELPIESRCISYINEEEKIAALYSAADVFVVPSLEDNLPNTIMEALSCGTPVVAFNTGGIPEMVTHKTNGYLAKLKDASDLANGINWVLSNSQYETLSKEARKKVIDSYSEEFVAKKYIELYTQLLNKK